MAVEIKYNGSTIANLEGGQTATLPCNGKKMKSDLTVIAPEGGGGGGECSGVHINIVDELPQVGVEGAYYGVNGFADVFVISPNQQGLLKEQSEAQGQTMYVETTKLTIDEFNENYNNGDYDNIFDNYDGALFYITDIQDIYAHIMGMNMPLSQMLGVSFKGEITDTAQATEQGYYAYMGVGAVYQYSNGEYRKLVKKGELKYTSNGDGTCEVSGIEDYHDTNIVIPSISPSGDTVIAIGDEAFYECLLESIEFPETLTSVGGFAFQDCLGIARIYLPDGVTEIHNYAFDRCYTLLRVTIPASVTRIGIECFAGCNRLATIEFKGTMEQWNAVEKDSNWNTGISATAVGCTDGTVTL